MLFNSYSFIFVFLPLTLAGYFLVGQRSPRLALAWLMAASLVFHAWWNWQDTLLMLTSIMGNLVVGSAIQRSVKAGATRTGSWLLSFGIAGNLWVLAYFKYAAFLLSNLAGITGSTWSISESSLPLGISFFTFTQIAFLVDARRALADDADPIRYGLFVTYFPHLLAGPIIHHREIMPQFAAPGAFRPNPGLMAAGLTVFLIGLFKKVFLADGCVPYVAPVFAGTAETLGFFQAWGGAIGYGLQLYFDFSGYSDMAIGLSLMFGIRLPLNFNSPYKSTSIIDFWRRWHMTLSRFLKEYLYIPLGGNRHGRFRRYLSLLLTMLLGGLWHGAAWTFVVWGGLHGVLLMLNHGFRELSRRLGWQFQNRAGHFMGWLLTFASVSICWVFFRADDLPSAWGIVRVMLGVDGFLLPGAWKSALGFIPYTTFSGGFDGGAQLAWTILLVLVACFAPNTAQWMSTHRTVLDPIENSSRYPFRLGPVHAALAGGLAWLCLLKMSSGSSSFIYYNF